MARTNSVWLVAVYYDKDKKELFKMVEFNSLREIAYCLKVNIYDVSNFYHRISKSKGVFDYVMIYKSL